MGGTPMKRIFTLLLIFIFLLTSCNADPSGPAEASSEIAGSEQESTAEQETESEVTWYFPTFYDKIDVKPMDSTGYPEEIKKVYLTFPSVFETTANGIDYTIEFFDEDVYMFDYIFLRQTVTNVSDSSIDIHCSLQGAGYFLRDDGEKFMSHGNNHSFSDDTRDTASYRPGFTDTFEVCFRADPEFFKVGHSYVFVVGFYPMELQMNGTVQTVEIPVQINTAQ